MQPGGSEDAAAETAAAATPGPPNGGHSSAARQAKLYWLAIATAIAVVGAFLAPRYASAAARVPYWFFILAIVALLGLSFVRQTWARRAAVAGYLLLASAWAIVGGGSLAPGAATAITVSVTLAGAFFFTYLAYREWLRLVRARVERKPRAPRPHPYANELSTEAETRRPAAQVTVFWLGLATVLTLGGIFIARRFSTYIGATPSPDWESWTLFPLFTGLALLGFGFSHKPWARRLTLVGWLLFGFFWALTAFDLLVAEGQDYVNFTFALVGVYFFTYLAYHEWLSLARRVDNVAVHFLSVATFVAAGAYFLIDKIQWLRLNLIYVVSDHTKWGLDLFGQGDKAGLVFLVDAEDNKSPTTFFYPEQYCDPYRSDAVGQWCAQNSVPYQITDPDAPSNLWEQIILYSPASESLEIVPVAIILACTALQSIMLFVGLFAGTTATWQRKLKFSLGIGALIYVLNLIRNVGIIWFYGEGHASFWVMHNAIGKGGSLVAFVVMAFAIFKYFPEFFRALVGVIELPDRDGPLERTLRIGKRRPAAAAEVPTTSPPAAPPMPPPET